MKKYCGFLLLLLNFPLIHGQFGEQRIISATTERAYVSLPLDIDNDGFIDVLKSGGDDYQLEWHRNLDGEGNFGPEILVSDTPVLYLSIEFLDLDSDGDNDILYLGNNPRVVSWLENLDGLGNFGAPQLILDSPQDFIASIDAKDMDNDGDLDLVALRSDTFTYGIWWYENLDGMANFGTANMVLENAEGLHPPEIVDIDNDGNLDLLTSHENLGPAKLVWYKNLGNVLFDTEREIYQFVFSPSDWTSIYDIQYADINSDGQKDIAIISHNDDFGTFYHWFENLDNLGNFGAIQGLPEYGVFCDLDNDGDNDILGGEFLADRIFWLENTDGSGSFTIERTISTAIDFLKDLRAADLNNDGLPDVVSASLSDNKIAWYENTGVLEVRENRPARFGIYPNPTSGWMAINYSESISEIHLFNTLGQKIDVLIDTSELNLSKLTSGFYFLKIVSETGYSEVHKILKN